MLGLEIRLICYDYTYIGCIGYNSEYDFWWNDDTKWELAAIEFKFLVFLNAFPLITELDRVWPLIVGKSIGWLKGSLTFSFYWLILIKSLFILPFCYN